MKTPSNKIKTIFMGTADFAIPSFKAVLSDPRFEVLAVFTQPDKAIGRSGKLQKTPIKKIAEEHNIKVYQPEKIRDFSVYENNAFPLQDVDIIIVVSYAQIIPQAILEIPKYGCINVHGSLLPKYRGSSCIQASILNGDEKSGVTIMKMDAGMDTGNILKKIELNIDKKETTETLFKKISDLGGENLTDTIVDYIDGKIKPEVQDNSKSSVVKKTKKEDGKIDWNNTANHIERQIRAMTSWPGAWTNIDGKFIKILEADIYLEKINEEKEIGKIFNIKNDLIVKCGDGYLQINKLQIEGKKPISDKDFINGCSNLLNSKLE